MFSTPRSIGRVAALFAGLVLVLGLGIGTAHAQEGTYVSDEGQEQGEVGNGAVDPGEVEPDEEILGVAVNRSSGSTLPLTGGETMTLAAFGGGVVLVGAAAVFASRRRSADV